MSQRGALDPNEVPMLGGVPKRCPCKSVPFCSCWSPLVLYRSGVPAYLARVSSLVHSCKNSLNSSVSSTRLLINEFLK